MRQNGTVKFFNTTKGFGFITPDGGSKDVFVHITALERAGIRSLNEGQKVNFEVVNERGDVATVLKGAPASDVRVSLMRRVPERPILRSSN